MAEVSTEEVKKTKTTSKKRKTKRKVTSKKKPPAKKKRGITLTEEEAKKLKIEEEKQALRQNPEVAKLVNRYKEVGFRWNQITAFLTGKTQVNPEFSEQDQIQWLIQAYHFDVLFLLQQLGIVEVPENPEELPTQEENSVETEK